MRLDVLVETAGAGGTLPEALHAIYGGPLGFDGPTVYTNFVSSLDGTVALPGVPSSNKLIAAGSEADRFVMGLLRALADVVVVGAGTLAGSPSGTWTPERAHPPSAPLYAELGRPRPELAVLTGSGAIDPRHPGLAGRAVVLTTHAGAARLAGRIPASTDVVPLAGEAAIRPEHVLAALRDRGHETILFEAGPQTFGAFAAAGLVDELFLTVSPLLTGGSAMTRLSLVEGMEPTADGVVAGDLLSLRRHGGHLFLRYRLRAPRPARTLVRKSRRSTDTDEVERVRDAHRRPKRRRAMETFELAIAGGGLTAARAIKSYREAAGAGRIALVSDESVLPYHRPALSKKYLRGEKRETPIVEDEAFYAAHDVELLLGEHATSLDAANRVLVTSAGPLHYEKLLIATGSRRRRLRVPGADLDGVFGLRTLADSQRIQTAASAAKRAVVVGAGFIGMEAAASLRQLGLEVTLIHMGSGLFDVLGSEELSAELLDLYRENGVDVLLGEVVAGFGGAGTLAHVETQSGLRISADLAVVGIGVVPNVEFLDGSEVGIDEGIVVDERFRTSAPGVYAAGDVASFFDPLFGRRRRIEHWSNANYQGAEVGRILAGQGGGYSDVSSFFSEVFGVTVKVFGDVSRFDEQAADGSLEDGLLVRYGIGGRLVGALTVAQSEEVETLAKTLIAERAPIRSLDDELVA